MSLIKADPRITKVAPGAGGWDPVTFTAGHHPLPATAKVSLAPEALLTGVIGPRWITTLAISGLQRTPSPFSGRMGDHTTAWQSVVDSIQAAVYGKPIEEAAAAVEALQKAAEASLKEPDGAGRLLFRWMEQIDAGSATGRLQRMEDAAQTVAEQCARARKATSEHEAAAALSAAVAQHLAFLNYLPFSTVPAASDRGSTGSGEGTHRAALLRYEIMAAIASSTRRTKKPLPKPTQKELENAKAAVWGMFSFDAVLREAHIDYALNPAAAAQVARQYDQLVAVDRRINDALEAVASDTGRPAAQDDLEQAVEELKAIIATDGVYRDILRAAGHLKSKAQNAQERLTQPYTLDRAAQARKLQAAPDTQDHLERAARVAADIKRIGDGDQAASLAIDVLSHLMYRHLSTMAAAYPHAVTALGLPAPDGGRLGAQAGAKLAEQVEAAMRVHYPDYFADDTKPARLGPLCERIAAQLAAMPAIPVTPSTSTWASEAQSTGLVVTVKPGEREKLQVNGRAPAPPAVSGMGCHTTAWVMETQHANYLVRKARDEKEVIAKLRDAVLGDLDSDLMGLTHLLPVDQIRGRQLTSLFDQAAAVLTAETASQAAAAYLSFRNLLPYATVDEGDRSGKRERKDGGRDETYDKAAIELAGARLEEELTKAGDDVITSLREEDELLRRQAGHWDFNPALARAVEATRERLAGLADDLTDRRPSARAALGARGNALLLKTRQAEHRRVWTEAKSFRDGK
ncbi:unnamed protein product [[Actinomadura] parvosata subsp. kistnae]|uniref:Uncharacterized protein n=1 Tax=[Actinomadura] parvosata subsp. kistnae TaxID=1909395 RepID=A0A1U9ZY91_9ACTN|nr:hypothetical protein [Nonomuraea sp. ATCC 55076]AQZ62900.1 hypothetical protein BKM31_16820 [Nonomuraea sp. ATCC 55076]SPL95786.1 unnamed protein product [Actinomadura parvosata subsp. kistnae]